MTATSPAERPLSRPDPYTADLVERVAEIAAQEAEQARLTGDVQRWVSWGDLFIICDDIRNGDAPESDIEAQIEHFDLFDRLGLTPRWIAAERTGVRL